MRDAPEFLLAHCFVSFVETYKDLLNITLLVGGGCIFAWMERIFKE
jgi:hypothetical protein